MAKIVKKINRKPLSYRVDEGLFYKIKAVSIADGMSRQEVVEKALSESLDAVMAEPDFDERYKENVMKLLKRAKKKSKK